MTADGPVLAPEDIVLASDETVLWHGHPRLMVALPAVAAGVLLAAVGVGFGLSASQVPPLALVPIGLGVAARGYLVVSRTRFVVSDAALYRRSGVLSRDVRRMRLSRVQNSTFRQGVRGRLFGYGTVDVEAAGGGRIAFTDVDGPREVRALVERRTAGGELPGTAAQWEAVLEETRALGRAFARRSEGAGEDDAG